MSMRFLNYFAWLLRALLFIALLLFALKNTDPVTLHFYLDRTWQAPLILVLLAFFALGAALGVLACLTKLFAQRREILALKREMQERPPAEPPPIPPSMGA
jgi:lipopolysaccharide assembly protein A